MVSNRTDQILWVDMVTKKEKRLDYELNIGNIKAMYAHGVNFYLIYNKENRKFGYYVLQLS